MIPRKTKGVSLLCNKCLEGHKILQVARGKIGSNFSVLKCPYFLLGPPAFCSVGTGGPSL